MSPEDAGRTLVAGLRAHVLVDCGRAARRYRAEREVQLARTLCTVLTTTLGVQAPACC